MVAPHVKNQLTRSLVRIPNSGVEKPQEVNLLDLSRVSTAAALVQATQGIPLNLFTSRRPSSSSKQLPVDRNAQVYQQRAPMGVSSGPTSSSASASLHAASGNVTQSTTPAALSATGSRKRSLPMVRQDAAYHTTSTTTAGEMKPAKVSKPTTAYPRQQVRRTPPRRRVTKEQLLREVDQLRSENETLRSRHEACLRYIYLSMHNQQMPVSREGGNSGLQVH